MKMEQLLRKIESLNDTQLRNFINDIGYQRVDNLKIWLSVNNNSRNSQMLAKLENVTSRLVSNNIFLFLSSIRGNTYNEFLVALNLTEKYDILDYLYEADIAENLRTIAISVLERDIIRHSNKKR